MWVTTHEWQHESCMSCLSRIRKRFTQISSYSLFILNVPIRIYLPILQQFAKETLHLVFLAMNPVEQAWMFVLCLPARGREPRGPYTESRVICSWSEVKVIQSCPTLCDPMGYTVHGILQTRILEWVAFPFSRGIFPTQVSNPGLPHCRWILDQLSHQGNPKILEWVAYPFCSGSSPPKNQTGVSCIAGRFFTNWALLSVQNKTGLAAILVRLAHGWHLGSRISWGFPPPWLEWLMVPKLFVQTIWFVQIPPFLLGVWNFGMFQAQGAFMLWFGH